MLARHEQWTVSYEVCRSTSEFRAFAPPALHGALSLVQAIEHRLRRNPPTGSKLFVRANDGSMEPRAIASIEKILSIVEATEQFLDYSRSFLAR